VFKSHIIDLDIIKEKYSDKYDLYFIVSERDDLTIDSKYKDWKNVITFNYKELLETETNTLEYIVNNIYEKLLLFLPSEITISKESGYTRIKNMNSLYESIKYKPFSYVDDFYELHVRIIIFSNKAINDFYSIS
jgi:hypothetical protein